jgi:DNA-binding transcriptional LysR family regulator
MTSIDHIDLNLLRVFHAIVEECSLTRAGERLTLSQPAISYSLGRLRTLFDDPLFIRTRSGMQPTPTALELAEIVGRALDTVREAVRHAERFDPTISTRTFRLSLSDAGELAYLPPICEALGQRAPNVKLQVSATPIGEIDEAMRANRLDFAIGHLPSLTATTRYRTLFEETYVCITRRRRGLPPGATLNPEQFNEAVHVRVTSVEHSHHSVSDAFRANGIHRKVALELSHFASVPNVLGVTDWYATLPRRLAHIFNRDKQFCIYEPPVKLPGAAVTLHWHDNFDQDEGNAWLRELMVEIIGKFQAL